MQWLMKMLKKFAEFFEEQLDKKVLPLSSVSGRNIEMVKSLMLKCVNQIKQKIEITNKYKEKI